MKRTVLLSSTVLAIITVLELSQASKALPTNPATVEPTVNESVETLFNSNQSYRQCRDRDGGKYACPRFVTPPESEE